MEALANYRESMSTKLENLDKQGIFVRARQAIMQRFFGVLENVRNAQPQESVVIEKILKNITLEEVNQALVEFRQRSEHK